MQAEHGLIVKQPWANQIIQGKKHKEFRSRPPPIQYSGIPIFLLSQGLILGIIKITGFMPNYAKGCTWYVSLIEEYARPIPYRHKNGARIWVRNVNKLQTKLA